MNRFRTLLLALITITLLPLSVGCGQQVKVPDAPAQALLDGEAKTKAAEEAKTARVSDDKVTQLWRETASYYSAVAGKFPKQPEGIEAARRAAKLTSTELNNDYEAWIILRNAHRQNVGSASTESATLDAEKRALEQKIDKANAETFPRNIFYKTFDLLVRVCGNNQKVSPGIALLILSILVAVLLWPMQKKMYLSSKEMLKYQPDIKKIQEKYKDEPLLVNQKIQQFYKERGINNPMSGCLMIIPQTLITLTMFQLVSAYQFHFVGAEFLWINMSNGMQSLHWPAPLTGLIGHDLSEMDLVMLTAYALSQLALSKMMPPPADPQQAEVQKMVGTFFPLMYFMIMLQNQLPSALALYYFISTLLGIARQWMLMREFGAPNAAAATPGSPTLIAPPDGDAEKKPLAANAKLISPKNKKK